MNLLELEITQQHLDAGTPLHYTEQPIAHALREMGATNARVAADEIRFDLDGKTHSYLVRDALREWIEQYDSPHATPANTNPCAIFFKHGWAGKRPRGWQVNDGAKETQLDIPETECHNLRTAGTRRWYDQMLTEQREAHERW